MERKSALRGDPTGKMPAFTETGAGRHAFTAPESPKSGNIFLDDGRLAVKAQVPAAGSQSSLWVERS